MIIEGSGVVQLAHVIRKIGYNEYDKFRLATIVSTSPTIVRVDGVSIDFDANFLIIAEHLTERKQRITMEDGTSTEMTFHSPLQAGDRVIVASMSGSQFYLVIDKAVMI